MTRFEEYRERIAGFWKEYRKSKMGLAGLGIIFFFVGVALIAPVVCPWPQPVLINLAPRLSAPLWLMPINPYGFTRIDPLRNSAFTSNASTWQYGELSLDEGYTVIANPHFTGGMSGWTFRESGGGTSVLDGFYNSTYGLPADKEGSGPGCFEWVFEDTSETVAYGDTHAYLEYSFLFNASRYPPGLVSIHPSNVSIRYGVMVEYLSTATQRGDSMILFSIEIYNSSAIPVSVYSRRYIASVDWTSREKWMSQENITMTFTTTDTITLSMHLIFRDPSPQDTPRVRVYFDDIQVFIRAKNADPSSVPYIEGHYNPNEGNPDTSGPGCYQFTFQDDDNETYYPVTEAWIQSNFTWDYFERPREAYLVYSYRIDVSGDIGDAYVEILLEVIVEKNGHVEVVLSSDAAQDFRESHVWAQSPRKVMDAFMIINTFDERGNLWVRYKVKISDPTPEDTPKFTVYLDDCQIEVYGNYYGLLGAGQYGEDLWAQLLWGSRIAILVGLAAAAIATFIGLIVGLVSGYFGGLIDEVLMRVTDFFLIIPGLPLMIVLAAILGPSCLNIILVIAIVGWTGTARLVRSQVLAERQKAYVEAAHAIGASDLYIIFRHILPNVTPLLFAQITLAVAGSILSEAGLAFLGLTSPYDVSWGRMLMQASSSGAYSRGTWWYVFFPGLCIVLLALSFTMVGYAVDQILNPRLRVRKK